MCIIIVVNEVIPVQQLKAIFTIYKQLSNSYYKNQSKQTIIYKLLLNFCINIDGN